MKFGQKRQSCPLLNLSRRILNMQEADFPPKPPFSGCFDGSPLRDRPTGHGLHF